MCVMSSSFHSRTAHVLWDQGGLHTRGRDGGWDVPCIPVVAPPHHAPIRDRPHLHCSMLPPSPQPCALPLIPCCTHAFATAFANPQCTLAQSAMHACHGTFAPTNCFSTSPSLHSLHPSDVGCVHSRAPQQLHADLMFENLCAPPHHVALPCQQSHGLTPPLHTIPCHSCWEVTRRGHGKRSPCPVPPNHPPTTRECVFEGGPVRVMVCVGTPLSAGALMGKRPIARLLFGSRFSIPIVMCMHTAWSPLSLPSSACLPCMFTSCCACPAGWCVYVR